MKNFSNYWNAISFAFIKHGNLRRKTKNVPYVIHPIRVVSILRAAGFNEFKNENLMIAALFHDLVEDTDTSLVEIESQFGTSVALIVAELTKPNGATGREKEKWLESFTKRSREAKIIKMADRIDNLMEKGYIWTEEKQKLYAEQAIIILKSCGDANKKLADRLDYEIKRILEVSLLSEFEK
ncbi:MAG: HD domain-containing protein [Candidatus Hodarchaeota archaeon]